MTKTPVGRKEYILTSRQIKTVFRFFFLMIYQNSESEEKNL